MALKRHAIDHQARYILRNEAIAEVSQSGEETTMLSQAFEVRIARS